MDKVIGVSFQLLSKVGWVEIINQNLGKGTSWVRFSFFPHASKKLLFGWGERNVWEGRGFIFCFLKGPKFLGWHWERVGALAILNGEWGIG
jgi:hypothetical protein